MADDPNPSQSPPRNARRSSFAGQTFADLFSSGGRPSMNRGSTDAPAPSPSSPPAPQPVGPISKAAQQAQQRRLSLTTLGLSGSPNQSSPFAPFRSRGDSISSASANSGSIDESAIAEDEAPRDQNNGSPTNTPFARRTSFGARALRDIRGNSFSGASGSPGSPGQNGTNPPPSSSNDTSASKANAQKNATISSRDAKGRGSSEGFNWSENLRSRAERTSSIAGQGGLGFGGVGAGSKDPSRSKSVAVMEPPPVAPPKPKEKPRPDHFQERILKGDFYMD